MEGTKAREKSGGPIVPYAGDLVILGERRKADKVLQWMRAIRGKLKLMGHDE
ncbi:MAG: hypothetical protein ACLPXB_04100 [Thiobacillaceae bacterium]